MDLFIKATVDPITKGVETKEISREEARRFADKRLPINQLIR